MVATIERLASHHGVSPQRILGTVADFADYLDQRPELVRYEGLLGGLSKRVRVVAMFLRQVDPADANLWSDLRKVGVEYQALQAGELGQIVKVAQILSERTGIRLDWFYGKTLDPVQEGSKQRVGEYSPACCERCVSAVGRKWRISNSAAVLGVTLLRRALLECYRPQNLCSFAVNRCFSRIQWTVPSSGQRQAGADADLHPGWAIMS